MWKQCVCNQKHSFGTMTLPAKLLASCRPIAPASSIKARPPSLQPMRRLTNISATASSVSAFSFNVLPTSLVATTQCEARLAGLPPSAFVWLNNPIRLQ